MNVRHKKKHDLDDTNDHIGISGAEVNEIIKFDANGLPALSGLKQIFVTRAVPATGFDYIEIGKFAQARGSFAIIVAISSQDAVAGNTGTDLYYITGKYDETLAAWELAYPLQTNEPHSQLCVMIDDAELHLRLIAITSTPSPVTVSVQIIDLGIGDAVFTAATGTGTMALPTTAFASTLISQVQGKIQMHAEMGMNSEKITVLAAGSAGTTNACNVTQMEDHVLAAIGDNVSKSPPMIAATTAALPANTRTADVLLADANGEFPTIDGIPPVANQDYLVKNEGGGASHINNGIYTLTIKGTAGTKWQLTRRHDMEGGENASGAMCPIASGTGAGDTTFKCINNIGSDTINTDALEFWFWGQTTDHNNLKNKAWSVAGHTMDTTLDMGTNPIENVVDPTNPQDAVTKNFIQPYYAESNGLSTITGIGSNSFQTKTSITITVNGTYIITASFQLSGDDTGTEFQAELYNGAAQIDLHQIVPVKKYNEGAIGNHFPNNSLMKQAVISGSTTISLRYRTTDTGKTVAIKNANIYARRIA